LPEFKKDAVWGLTLVGPRNHVHVLDEVEISHRKA